MIFKNCSKPTLVSCACVCRRWKHIALDNDLWTRIDLSQRKIPSGIMIHVLSKKPIVLRMAQTEVWDHIHWKWLSTLYWRVTGIVLGVILQVCPPMFTDNPLCLLNINSKIEYLDLSMAVICVRGKRKARIFLEVLPSLSFALLK